jgi:2-oxo-3-hexenedioate decarboxylase
VTDEQSSALADALLEAERTRTPVAPFTDSHPELDVEAGYAVQQLVLERRLAAGDRLVGAKLGLTSRAKQEQMSVLEPIHGWLTESMLSAPSEALDLDRFIHPRAEAELLFVLGRELEGPATVADVLRATESIMAAVEIIDSRFSGFTFKLPDVVADNGSAASLVLGPVARAPKALGDLRLVGCLVRDGGEIVATAAGAAVLGHPAQAVAWLATRLAQSGRSLPAGSIILSGALTDARPIAAGGHVAAELDGLGIVEVFA